MQEVLTSVQRMEESLKRLKKVKGQVSSSSGDASSKGLSDDDKIRCQILLDVTRLSSQVRTISAKLSGQALQSVINFWFSSRSKVYVHQWKRHHWRN